jgi:Pretoxin HINT domain
MTDSELGLGPADHDLPEKEIVVDEVPSGQAPVPGGPPASSVPEPSGPVPTPTEVPEPTPTPLRPVVGSGSGDISLTGGIDPSDPPPTGSPTTPPPTATPTGSPTATPPPPVVVTGSGDIAPTGPIDPSDPPPTTPPPTTPPPPVPPTTPPPVPLAPTGDACFVRGTPVASSRGMIPIEAIAASDSIYTFGADHERLELNDVDKTFASRQDEVMTLIFDGDEIRCTPPHCFYTGRWTPASALEVGNLVLSKTGKWQVLREIRRERDPQTVYNLLVTPGHSYLVGHLGFLVHNKDEQQNGSQDGGDQEQPS